MTEQHFSPPLSGEGDKTACFVTVTSNLDELQKLLKEASELADALNDKLKKISRFELRIRTKATSGS